MGCAASVGSCVKGSSPKGSNGNEKGILIDSAKNLRDADWVLSTSDPYAICRLGPVASSWEAKPRDTERASAHVYGSVNPEWNFAFLCSPQENWELQVRVYDKDFVSFDEFLGEVQIPVAQLESVTNQFNDYPLNPGPGVLKIMSGSKVAEALHEELKKLEEAEKRNGWFSSVIIAAQKLGQYFKAALTTPYYWAQLAQMATAWRAVVWNESDKSVEWFRHRSTNSKTGVNNYEWDGPEIKNSLMLMGHPECQEKLKLLGPRFGTTNGDGEVFKPNFLGVQELNKRFWPDVPWNGIGLALPQEPHAWIRPLLTKLLGPGGKWSSQWLVEEARSFFQGRESVVVPDDLRMWVTQILQQILLGVKPTEEEAHEFMQTQKKVIIAMALPEAALDTQGVAHLSDELLFNEILQFREKQMARCRSGLKARLPEETASISEADLTMLASAVLDALLFAGGQSVPTVISYALSMPYSAYGQSNLPKDFSLADPAQLPCYIWEVIRRFPPVTAFVYQERAFGSEADKRIYLNLQMAQQDPRLWGGPDSTRFVMRHISEYHEKSLGFAETSMAPLLESPNSHSCPAKDLAYSMALNFVHEFARTAQNAEGGHKSLWIPRSLEDEGRPVLKSNDIEFNLYGSTRFVLSKDASVEGPREVPASNAWLLEKLKDHEKSLLKENVHRKNKMDECNANTRIFIAAVQQIVKRSSPRTSTNVKPPLPYESSEGDFLKAPFGGLRFLKDDEDENDWRVNAATTVALSIVEMGLTSDDVEAADEPLLWFDSRQEAAITQDIMFGPSLPPAFNQWEDIGSDSGTRALCVFGVGAWYLQAVTPANQAGHEVPRGASFECNIEYLSSYATRSKFISYGHTLYLAAPSKDSVLPGDVLGVWSCHHKKLFVPGDSLWEHAKAGFRTSLCTSLVLKDHLAYNHWIIANGLMIAARSMLSPDHPLRRLLKQFYYRTAAINEASYHILAPQGQLAHRTFAFTNESWLSYFSDLCTSWEWVPFPKRMKARGLPEHLLNALPLCQDGELLWHTLEKYMKAYLSIFYFSDSDILADLEIVAFWAHFESQMDTPWKLPELGFDTLVSLLADLAWWVTGGHESVGAIVEYLTTLSGIHPKLVDGRIFPDVQTFAQSLIIISLTGISMPALMDDWTHIFQVDSWKQKYSAKQRQDVLDIVRELQFDLARVSDEIANRNILRERTGGKKSVAFDPRILETSVSI